MSHFVIADEKNGTPPCTYDIHVAAVVADMNVHACVMSVCNACMRSWIEQIGVGCGMKRDETATGGIVRRETHPHVNLISRVKAHIAIE